MPTMYEMPTMAYARQCPKHKRGGECLHTPAPGPRRLPLDGTNPSRLDHDPAASSFPPMTRRTNDEVLARISELLDSGRERNAQAALIAVRGALQRRDVAYVLGILQDVEHTPVAIVLEALRESHS